MSLSLLRAILITDPIIIIATIVFASLSLVVSPFDPRGRLQHAMARGWARVLVCGAGLRMRVEGAERLDPKQVYIFIGNHASFMDIPVVLDCLPVEIRFLAKRSLFNVPFMGWHLRRAGHIPVFLDEPRGAVRTLTDAAHTIRRTQVSVLLFPEGGRVPEGLGEFKEGAAYLAIKSGVPVVPFGLAGMRQVLPMDRLFDIRSADVELRIGEPIPITGWSLRDRERLTALFRERIASLLPTSDGGTREVSDPRSIPA